MPDAAVDTRPSLILTGASRGIGHATVKRFSAAGWRVITCSRQPFGAVMMVLEAEGDPEAVAEFRQVFGATVGSA